MREGHLHWFDKDISVHGVKYFSMQSYETATEFAL